MEGLEGEKWSNKRKCGGEAVKPGVEPDHWSRIARFKLLL